MKKPTRREALVIARSRSSEVEPKIMGSYETPLINEYRYKQAWAERLASEKGKFATNLIEQGGLTLLDRPSSRSQLDAYDEQRARCLREAQIVYDTPGYLEEVARERRLGHVFDARPFWRRCLTRIGLDLE